ncbi:hypothetical protein HS088_TW06G00205 [Tripterygium wilfordii]|uniref:Uncharacterized protein n=1 Tax=Tripterygium wilfordii TaxID=458696 RepID=A0A7J7DI51_TRIWF|nr:hypothetical protein HS088_TW06G00205 [Tripterygium wilfordii]
MPVVRLTLKLSLAPDEGGGGETGEEGEVAGVTVTGTSGRDVEVSGAGERFGATEVGEVSGAGEAVGVTGVAADGGFAGEAGDGVGVAVARVSISTFIPELQWPGVPQMKYLLPGDDRAMTVLPSEWLLIALLA